MNYFEFYMGDYARDTAHLSLAEHGAYLLLLSACYGTEKPLSGDYGALYRIARAMHRDEQAAVRKVADEFFPLGGDGLRHNVRVDAEIAKAAERMESAGEKKENEKERQRRTRARRTMLFAELREVGIVPDAMITMDELRMLHGTHVTRDMGVTDDVTEGVTNIGSHGDVTPVNTATRPQTPDPIEKQKQETPNGVSSASAFAEAPKRAEAIPYQAIIDLYNATMTRLPKVRELTPKRRTLIRSAWNASAERQSLDFWKSYFEECEEDPFNNGTGPYREPHANWRPTFDYLLRADVVTRVFEAALDRMERGQ